jgi:tetratricopeptide (TPR) repeat protein
MARINWLETMRWNDDQLEELRFLGYAYLRQGKYDIAISFFEALCVLEPDSAYDAQTLGALYLQMGNPAKALKYFDRALKLDADHSPTLLNLAKALFMLGKKEEGLKLANVLKEELNPSIANYAKALILAYS